MYPVGDVVPGLTSSLMLHPSSFNNDDIIAEMKAKEEATITSPYVDIEQLNKKLPSTSKIQFNAITFGSIFLRFPKAYYNKDTILKFNDVTIEIKQKKTETNQTIEDSTNETPGSGMSTMIYKLLNLIVKNFQFEASNIKLLLKIDDKVSYSLMIRKISYDKMETPKPIEAKDKAKYLFCHNKKLSIEGIVIKENYDKEKDDVFYKSEEENKVMFYTQKEILLMINSTISFNIEHDFQKKVLLISNDNAVNIESIITKEQIEKCLSIKSIFDENSNNSISNEESKPAKALNPSTTTITTPTPNEINILGFGLDTININFNVSYAYFLIVDNVNIKNAEKPKFWLIYDNYFSKYYENHNESKLSLLQKHFCYYEEIFFILYLDNILSNLQIKYTHTNNILQMNNATFKLIQPNKIESKKKIIIISNSIPSNQPSTQVTSSSSESTFNDIFMNYYIKIVNFSFYSHDIIHVEKLNIDATKIKYETTSIEINAVVINKIKTIIDSFNLTKKSAPTALKEEENKMKEDIKIVIEGNVNIKLIINKRAIKYTKKEIIPIDNDYYNETIIFSFIHLHCNFCNNKKTIEVNYDKMISWLFIGNISYPFIAHYQNTKDNTMFKGTVSPLIKFNIDIHQLFIFVNPTLIQYLITYLKLFSYSFMQFLSKRNKDIEDGEVSVEDENNKRNISVQKVIEQFISLIHIKEISVVLFGNISMKANNKIDIKKINSKNETIFKFILNPLLKFTIGNIEYDFGNHQIKIGKVDALMKKQDNTFQNDILVYQNFISNSNKKSFESILYSNDDTTSNIILQLNDMNTFFISINSIVINPITKYHDEILILCEHAKREYIKMNSVIQIKFPTANETIELVAYEKIFNGNNDDLLDTTNSNNSKTNSTFNYKIDIKIKTIYVDVFSIYQSKKFSTANSYINSALNRTQKDKMRCIMKISNINSSYDSSKVAELSVNQLEVMMIKDLDVNPKVIEDISNETFYDNLIRIGFANILNASKLKIESKNNNTINKLSIDKIDLHFCSDSFKYFIAFINKAKIDINNLSSMYSSIEDDKESIVTDVGMLQEKYLKDQLRNKGLGQSGIEFRSIGRAYTENAKLHSFNLKYAKTASMNSGSSGPNSGKRKEVNNYINEVIDEKENNNSNSQKTYNIQLNVNNVSLNMYKGEDFNFQSEYLAESNACVEKINYRNAIEFITSTISSISVKLTHIKKSQLIFSIYSTVKSIIVKDNIPSSKYKVMFSHYNYDSDDEIIFAIKCDIARSPNGNGENDINTIIDISPLVIYLDQSTMEFLISFFIQNEEINTTSQEQYYTPTMENNLTTTDNEISQMNYSQYKATMFNLNMSLNPESFYICRFIINSFFISFNYNAKDFSYEKAKSEDPVVKYSQYLNLLSINDMMISFKEFNSDYSDNAKRIKAKKIKNELIEFYQKDILDNQAVCSYLRATPLLGSLCNIMDGTSDMVCFAYDSYKKDIPVEIGMVNGVRSFVKSTTSELLSLAEKTSSIIQRFNIFSSNSNESYSLFTKWKYNIDDKEKKKAEYFMK